MTAGQGSVLIVDDDDDIRELMMMVLRSRGYAVAGADDGLKALEELRTHAPPDLVLLDLRMPRMAGDDFVDALRRDPALSDVAVVVVSGDSTARQRASELAVQGCLLKPVDLSELLSTVDRFANGGADGNGRSRSTS